ncbi:hypothetical protein KY285_020199 [Solanum tuberosum]|nr:hypothetical protein KY285_020199 [Solanum tuberosum]
MKNFKISSLTLWWNTFQGLAQITPRCYFVFWVEHKSFLDVVRKNWDLVYSDNPFLDFKRKSKNVKKALSMWSKETFGDIFKQLLIREEVVRIKEKHFEESPNHENRVVIQKARAEYTKYLRLVKGRRNNLKVSKIMNEHGCWLDQEVEIAEDAIKFYQKQFTQERDSTDLSLLSHIPMMIKEENNGLLGKYQEKRKSYSNMNHNQDKRGVFTFKYLGCPVSHSRKRMEHFAEVHERIPTLVQWSGGSQQWKAMLMQREKVEQHLWWEPKGGTSTIWYDNWSKLGPLFCRPSDVVSCHPLKDISEFLNEDGWNLIVMKEMLPRYVVDHVEKEMRNTVLYGGQYRIGKIFWEIDTILGRWLKCNTDGASKGNPGLSSVAFCIRDHTGDLVVAIGKRIEEVPSLKAEALAIKECLEYCHRMNYKKIILEIDSWSLVQILQGTWERPWNVILEIKSIRSLFRGEINFNNADELPARGRYILNLDKLGSPNIRSIVRK